MNQHHPYKIIKAEVFHLDEIMALEQLGFDPTIQEERSVFEERIRYFQNGFLVLIDTQQSDLVIGYICSELWTKDRPLTSDTFLLGHSIRDSHNEQGDTLYISSFAIHPEYRKHGLGKLLFESLHRHIFSLYPSIESTLLVVNEIWTKAKLMYEQQGYVTLFCIDSFFPGENGIRQKAVVMRKNEIIPSSQRLDVL